MQSLHGPGLAFSSCTDLADRAIFLTLAPIAAQRRRSEAEPGREFELARPCILGALLDAATHGLRTLPCVRLADFAIWATACETAFWSAASWRFYDANRRAAIDDVVDADPVANCV
ncbi:MAG TPA: hypothetical protein VFB88_07265 [Xanthobacteraceae bacterium]|nr:hypothetical protein [Xanthobacteraceae bacterium]